MSKPVASTLFALTLSGTMCVCVCMELEWSGVERGSRGGERRAWEEEEGT